LAAIARRLGDSGDPGFIDLLAGHAYGNYGPPWKTPEVYRAVSKALVTLGPQGILRVVGAVGSPNNAAIPALRSAERGEVARAFVKYHRSGWGFLPGVHKTPSEGRSWEEVLPAIFCEGSAGAARPDPAIRELVTCIPGLPQGLLPAFAEALTKIDPQWRNQALELIPELVFVDDQKGCRGGMRPYLSTIDPEGQSQQLQDLVPRLKAVVWATEEGEQADDKWAAADILEFARPGWNREAPTDPSSCSRLDAIGKRLLDGDIEAFLSRFDRDLYFLKRAYPAFFENPPVVEVVSVLVRLLSSFLESKPDLRESRDDYFARSRCAAYNLFCLSPQWIYTDAARDFLSRGRSGDHVVAFAMANALRPIRDKPPEMVDVLKLVVRAELRGYVTGPTGFVGGSD